MPDEYGLGRIYTPDARDNDFPMRSVIRRLAPRSLPTTRYWWDNGWWGNQGATSQCVAYSTQHWLADGPIRQPGVQPVYQPAVFYHDCQVADEWPGESPAYEGTSVRASMKLLQQRGLVVSYNWSSDANVVGQAILGVGPVVVGTNWYESMFNPVKGILHIEGAVAGGHAWVLNGYNSTTQMFRMKNSWGRQWGLGGRAFISAANLQRLLSEEGEGALAVETIRKAA